MAWLDRNQLLKLNFKELGDNVLISDRASLYGCENISVLSNTRIDDFCVISSGSSGISIGRNVHIATHSIIIGHSKITLLDFCNLSSRVAIYSSSDDFSGQHMTNPTVPIQFTGVVSKPVVLGKHVIVGTGSTILPGCELHEGVAIGAMSLVKQNCEAFWIYAGNPLRRIRPRDKKMLDLEIEFLKSST